MEIVKPTRWLPRHGHRDGERRGIPHHQPSILMSPKPRPWRATARRRGVSRRSQPGELRRLGKCPMLASNLLTGRFPQPTRWEYPPPAARRPRFGCGNPTRMPARCGRASPRWFEPPGAICAATAPRMVRRGGTRSSGWTVRHRTTSVAPTRCRIRPGWQVQPLLRWSVQIPSRAAMRSCSGADMTAPRVETYLGTCRRQRSCSPRSPHCSTPVWPSGRRLASTRGYGGNPIW